MGSCVMITTFATAWSQRACTCGGINVGLQPLDERGTLTSSDANRANFSNGGPPFVWESKCRDPAAVCSSEFIHPEDTISEGTGEGVDLSAA